MKTSTVLLLAFALTAVGAVVGIQVKKRWSTPWALLTLLPLTLLVAGIVTRHREQNTSNKNAPDERPPTPSTCYSYPGVSVPPGYVWVNGIDESRMKTIYDIRKAHTNKELIIRGDGLPDNGKDTLSAGYKYVAITVTESTGCGHYFVFGKTLPSIGDGDAKVEKEWFCSYGTKVGQFSGLKPDTACTSITNQSCTVDPTTLRCRSHPANRTTWKVRKLT